MNIKGYDLHYQPKIDRAKEELGEVYTEEQLLLVYDRLGGKVVKDGVVLAPQSLWKKVKNGEKLFKEEEKEVKQEVKEEVAYVPAKKGRKPKKVEENEQDENLVV